MRNALLLVLIICTAAEAQHVNEADLLEEAQRLLDEGKITEAVERLDERAGRLRASGDVAGYLTGHTDIADIYVQLGDYQLALRWLDRANIDSTFLSVSEMHVPLIEWQLYRGFVLEKLGDYIAAKEAYEKVRLQWMRPDDEVPLQMGRFLYQPLGNINARLGEYEQALLLLERFKRLSDQSDDYDAVAQASNDIGIVHKATGHLDRAVTSFQEALAFPELTDQTRGILHSNLASAYLDSGVIDESLQHSLKALHFLPADNENAETVAYRAWTEGIVSSIYLRLQQFDDALSAVDRALTLAKLAYSSVERREVSKLFTLKGEILLQSNDPSGSLKSFQDALAHGMKRFNPASSDELPLSSQLFAENALVEALDGKAKAYHALYRADTSDYEKIDQALDCYSLLFQVEDLLARQYEYQISKLRLMEERYQRSSAAMDLCYDGYARNKDESYLNFAFNLMERNKSTVLLESLGSLKTRRANAVPRALIKQELEHKREIAHYQRMVREYGPQDDAADSVWQVRLLRAEEAGLKFQRQLREEYPNYAHLTDTTIAVVDLSTVQASILEADQTLIEYFFADRSVYVVIIEKDSVSFLELDVTAHEVDLVRTYLEQIRTPRSGDGNTATSETLYNTFVAPLFPGGEIPSRLIIVPDAILMYLPFEVLTVSGRQHDLLLHHAAISYSFSASVLHAAKDVTPPVNLNLLAMAPGFTGSRTLSPLPYSTTEVKSLNQIVPADLKLGQNATKEFFLQHLEDYGIIHLSTHAAVDGENSLNSWIAFYESDEIPGDSSRLYLHEIYNLSLAAQLVILSACETGTGYLSQGEGIMSLSRGFAFAGCPSMVTTLWQVNDEATSRLTTGFYKYLSKGWDKDQALRQAKLDYIARDDMDDAGRHPFFWSSLILMGNAEPVSFETTAYTSLVITAVAIVVITSLFFLLGRKKRKTL